MTTPTIRVALDTFQQAANRGTAVYLSPELVQELRDALKAEPEGDDGDDVIDRWIESRPGWPNDWPAVTQGQLTALIGEALEHWGRIAAAAPAPGENLPPDYIDPEHTGQDRELLEVFYQAARAEGGTADECILRGVKAVLAARPAIPTTPPTPETPAETLAARPLLEQVAAMAGCTISSRAAAWLRDNPPGQPVRIEPRGCPTPGACSCVEPAPAAPETGEVEELVNSLTLISDGMNALNHEADSWVVARAVTLLQQQAAELDALRGVAVAVSQRPWERGGWCDHEGRCWLGSVGSRSNDPGWVYRKPCDVLHQTISLSHNAIPLPAPQAGEPQS